MRKLLIVSAMLTLALGAVAFPLQQGTDAQLMAVIQTSVGDLHCTLFPGAAPVGTANFVDLAGGKKDWTNPKNGQRMRGVPLYDNTIFHRVIPEFMIQGGDPAGSGSGNIGFKFKNEAVPDLTFDQPGRLAYANAGPDTNGSQFFVTEAPAHFLDGKYTIFGQCDDQSVDLVKKIARQPRGANDRLNTPVIIKHIETYTEALPETPKEENRTPEAAIQPIAPPTPPTDEVSAPPPTISLGLTTEQVTAILGQPLRIAKIGNKEIYSYRDLKVIFLNGKVNDIQ